jgi:hypothetical protein
MKSAGGARSAHCNQHAVEDPSKFPQLRDFLSTARHELS